MSRTLPSARGPGLRQTTGFELGPGPRLPDDDGGAHGFDLREEQVLGKSRWPAPPEQRRKRRSGNRCSELPINWVVVISLSTTLPRIGSQRLQLFRAQWTITSQFPRMSAQFFIQSSMSLAAISCWSRIFTEMCCRSRDGQRRPQLAARPHVDRPLCARVYLSE